MGFTHCNRESGHRTDRGETKARQTPVPGVARGGINDRSERPSDTKTETPAKAARPDFSRPAFGFPSDWQIGQTTLLRLFGWEHERRSQPDHNDGWPVPPKAVLRL